MGKQLRQAVHHKDGRASALVAAGRRAWARWLLSGSCAFSSCPIVIGSDAGRDASADVRDGAAPVACVDDEVLDFEFDRSMGIDCAAVRAAIDRRRKPEERAVVANTLRQMHRVQRCCVSRQTLIQWLRTPPELGGPTDPSQVRSMDRAIGMTLCDPLTRESRTQSWLSEHSWCFVGMAEPPPSDVAGGAR